RVLDFGLAKVDTSEGDAPPMQLTKSGVPLGTPAYMAPEQWWGAGVDARTDQYGFGAMLFEMLTGRPPFASQQFAMLVQQHLHDPPPSRPDEGHAASQAVEAFVACTLAKAQADRFTSMRALLEEGDRAFASAEQGIASESDAPPPRARIADAETSLSVITP